VIASVVSQIVAFGENDQIYTSGTATCIAKNIHITAAHVLTDLLKDQFGFNENQTHFDL
jgi:V8-like Glu-specific endopeptidase